MLAKLTNTKFFILPLPVYSRSLRFGFRDGSLERKPNVNRETKKITTV